ncbi:NAD(P)-dependent oxidoreductase [Sphingomonas yunnanensis]|uniref:NAD(P)-dependent oxidoreductase n=1 Tax=Sphingomonas yunnanensis TaxID=310400 RepID=UPI001CA66C13|nr:NAD(P)-dependent oxidoreductase [Sphingomonas yunnanensis]MBY9064821.1 NAD(P)-dependent oxidoreductase [Sphingomonas yunnanensis]
MKVGFIGLGQMGSAMAQNLLAAGHEVSVWNRSADKAAALVEAGARMASSPADAAQGEVVMTMLADDRAVEAVVWGEGGIAAAPALHVSHSTIGVALAERLAAEAGSGGVVSAPVFGRPPAAAAGKLFVVAAGEAAALDRAQPLFDAIGQRTFRIGDHPPAANIVKLSGNFMIMAAVEAMAEAMTLAERGGVQRAALLEILTETLFGAPVYRTYGEILVEDKFRPAGFPAPLGLKDMTLADAAATAYRVPMPLLGIVRDHLRATIAAEGEDIDWSATALAVRRGAGL